MCDGADMHPVARLHTPRSRRRWLASRLVEWLKAAANDQMSNHFRCWILRLLGGLPGTSAGISYLGTTVVLIGLLSRVPPLYARECPPAGGAQSAGTARFACRGRVMH